MHDLSFFLSIFHFTLLHDFVDLFVHASTMSIYFALFAISNYAYLLQLARFILFPFLSCFLLNLFIYAWLVLFSCYLQLFRCRSLWRLSLGRPSHLRSSPLTELTTSRQRSRSRSGPSAGAADPAWTNMPPLPHWPHDSHGELFADPSCSLLCFQLNLFQLATVYWVQEYGCLLVNSDVVPIRLD